MSQRERLLSTVDRRRYADVVDADGDVLCRIQSLTHGELMKCQSRSQGQDDSAWYIVMAVVEEDGSRTFSDADIDSVRKMDSAVAGSIAAAVVEHLSIDHYSIEDVVKNSQTTPSDAVLSN